MNITKQDYVIFIGAVAIFCVFFWLIPPTPIYFDDNGFNILPEDAQYEPETGRWITGYERSSIVMIAPLIALLWLLLIAFGEERPPLREIPFKAIIMHDIREKIEEGKIITKAYFRRRKE
jgi:hypothetical protein